MRSDTIALKSNSSFYVAGDSKNLYFYLLNPNMSHY